jgi:hypothetical protein
VEGIMNLMKKEEWGVSETAYLIQMHVFSAIIRYLASQQQDTLPYRISNVESND